MPATLFWGHRRGLRLLTEIACRNARPEEKPRKLSDSAGLHLLVKPSGHKSWRLKYRISGVEKQLVLGSYPDMSLREARDRRDEERKKLRDGLDPALERKKQRAVRAAESSQTLRRFAEDWHAARAPGWRPHYAKAVKNRLELDVFPALGSIPIGELTAPMVLGMLQKIERRGSLDVARRVRQHLSDIFRVAIAVGVARFDPAAGLDRALKARTKRQRPAVRSIEEARHVLATVEAANIEPTTRLASRLLALTAVRPGMVRLAEAREFEDLDGPAPIWRISAAKMKLTAERRGDLGFEFVVPLAPVTVELVRTAIDSFADGLLLPNRDGRPISDATISKIYRSAGFTDRHVPHGWRATFSTLMNEIAAIENRVGDRDIIDLMLAHVPNGVEAAYNRYAYLPRRRELACEWADLLMQGARPAADLVAARKRGRPERSHDRRIDGASDTQSDSRARSPDDGEE